MIRLGGALEPYSKEGYGPMYEGSDQYYELLTEGRPPVRFAAGAVIFEQGEPGEMMYVLREGAVTLTSGEREVETVCAPTLFGEMALISNDPRSLSAIAATDAVLVEIPARHFWVLVHDTPYFAQLVMSVMAQRLLRAGSTT